MRADGIVHGVVVVQRRRLRPLRATHVLLLLVLLPATFRRIGRSHDGIRSGLVCWVVEQCADIVHKQRVKQLRDLFFIRKIQCTFERDPAAASAPSTPDAKHVTYQTPLRCIGPILTTCRIFSLFKMPSRRPRVIPATLRSLVPLIMWLSVIRSADVPISSVIGTSKALVAYAKERTFPSGDTDAFCLNLKTEAALVFPQSRSHPRLHPGRSDLAGGVEGLRGVPLSVPTRPIDEAVRRWSTWRDCCTDIGQYSITEQQRRSNLPGKGKSCAGT